MGEKKKGEEQHYVTAESVKKKEKVLQRFIPLWPMEKSTAEQAFSCSL